MELFCQPIPLSAKLDWLSSHIASILFYLEATTQIHGKLACTQVKCSWILPTYVNEVPYARAKDIDFSNQASNHTAASSSGTACIAHRRLQWINFMPNSTSAKLKQ